MQQAEIEKMLQNHENRLATLEGEPKKKVSKVQKSKKSLSDYILELRDNGFFSQSKTAKEVHAKLQSTYQCALDRVDTALRRLAERKQKQLRKIKKKIEGNDYQAYVW